ncbi:MAG: hypothetical protein AAFX06_28720 [Planctomycetota bacterium]
MSDSVLLSDDHPVDPDDELLVAFLDDELDDQQRQKVEQRLLDDNSFATRLQALQSGWDFLDELPDVSSNEKLVESTLEMVVSEIAPVARVRQSAVRRHRTTIVVAVFSLIGLLGGAFAVAAKNRVDRMTQLKDLAIAEDLDAYLLGDDFDFFRDLDANAEWRAMLDAQDAGGVTMVTPSTIKEVALEDRAKFLRELPLDERGRLNLKWRNFSSRDEKVQAELRRTYESVQRQPDAERLLKTMKAFWAWRDTLDDKTKDGLVSEDSAERKKAFEEAIRRSRERLTRRSGSVISDEAAEVIYTRLYHYLMDRIESSNELSRRYKEAGERFGERRNNYFIFMMVNGANMRGAGGPPGRGGPGGRGPRGPGGARGDGRRETPPDGRREPPNDQTRDFLSDFLIQDEELLGLVPYFDDETIATLDRLTQAPADDLQRLAQLETLRYWCNETLRRKEPKRPDKMSNLERYREMKERKNADIVDLMEPDAFEDELQQPRDPRSIFLQNVFGRIPGPPR